MDDLGLDSPVDRLQLSDKNDDFTDALPADCIQVKIYLFASQKKLYARVFPEDYFIATMGEQEYK